ncbi:MAG: hypothetical protein IKJ87_03295 [Ruminococcus sp.]|nr:hypothetical protein [Ruminococcus sp.]
MRHRKFLSLITAAALAAAPASINAYAEGNLKANDISDNSIIEIDNSAFLVETKNLSTTSTRPSTATETSTTTTLVTAADLTTASQTTATKNQPTATTTSVFTTETTTTTAKNTTTETTSTTGTTTTSSTTTKPAIQAEKVTAVCEHINKADINGRVLVEIPAGVSADVTIVYESPEYDAHEYYKATLRGGKTYGFDVEGRDSVDGDYRIYKISVILSGGKYNITADSYSDSFTIPDGNDNPDSYREIMYKFTVDDKDSDVSWNVVNDAENKKEIAVHLNNVMKGDVNMDGIVDASDASLVLSEYAVLSTGGETSFSSKQIAAANVNNDRAIDSSDASAILVYYSKVSTGGTPSWD